MRYEPEYHIAKEMMSLMLENSQRPHAGNIAFTEAMDEWLKKNGLYTSVHNDPVYPDRRLLTVEVGDPQGEQVLVTTSHSDVVGIEGQKWNVNPWKLTESSGEWLGRGSCDTHASGHAMILPALDPFVQDFLKKERKRVTILFTYDEESTDAEFSMRGARLAAGLLGTPGVIEAKNYIAGEPTQIDGRIRAMRGHKGRGLMHFTINAPQSGHVSQAEQNALMAGSVIVSEIAHYGRMMRYGSKADLEAQIFHPPYTTVQVSAAEIKAGEYSTTPSTARFTVDMRTLPFVHELRLQEVLDLIGSQKFPAGETVTIELEKNGAGSLTPAEAPIIQIAERVTGMPAEGFNGGDEGRIFRNALSMQGFTMGPGNLAHAHMPDERVSIPDIFQAAKLFRRMYLTCAGLPIDDAIALT